ncbi:DUF3515 domain-containing protein, partial [Xanthomonas sp. Kuri4-2]
MTRPRSIAMALAWVALAALSGCSTLGGRAPAPAPAVATV